MKRRWFFQVAPNEENSGTAGKFLLSSEDKIT
jgi:hypothetical protein